MSCPFEDRLSELLYDEPSAEVREHLTTCASCQDAFAELESVGAQLNAAPIELPAALKGGALKERILAAVGQTPDCEREADLLTGDGAEHAAECAPCGESQAAFASVGRALDLVPEPALSVDDAEALRGRILAEVGQAPCPFEAELLWAPAAERAEHVASCAPCAEADRAFALVGRALDRVPLPMPSAERFAELKAEVTGAQKAGRVIRFPGALARLAAAVLFATTIGLTGYALVERPGVVPAQLTRMELEADVLVRDASGDANQTALSQAMQRYAKLSSAPDAQVATRARYEALGLQALQARNARRSQGTGSTAAAGAQHVSSDPSVRRRQLQVRVRDMLVSYQEVLIEFPGTRASLYAIKRTAKRALPAKEQPYGPLRDSPLMNVRPKRPGATDGMKPFNVVAHQRGLQHLLAQRPKVMRWDYAAMRKLGKLVVDPNLFNDPRLRQSVLLQRALQAEELTAVASSDVERDRLKEEAVRDLRKVIELAPKTKAADLARQALTRLI